ncbi:MAG: hypothetical protein PHD43_08620 [Methylococcales bacterium]|nr:hypothetical protein [Methylococcales bacterium]
MSNERKNTADLHPWDSVEGLGRSVSQQHKRAARHMGGYIEQSHLGRNRGSLAADLYRRYHRNSLSFFSGADFPLVNAFAHTSLQSDSRGRESLPPFSSLGLDPLHRMVNVSPHRLHIGGKHGLMDIKLRRSATGLTANQNSSMLIYPSKPSAQSSTVTSNATSLSLMPHSSSMLAHTSEQAIIHRKTGVITEKSSLENSLPAMDTHPSGGHFSYLAQRVVDRQSQRDFILNPAFETPVARFALLEHYNADSKTPPKADAVSGVPAISLKAEPSSEIIAREQQISSAAAQSGNNRSQSSVQRAISRHTGLLCQTHYEPRDNNVFKGEPSRFAGNELWTGNTLYFASPFVTVNRKFSLPSGNRFVGLGLGRKIAGRIVGTLSQPGYAADFIPPSAITKLALLEHYNADSKTAPRADAVSGVPAISLKAEPSSEIIAREQQISSAAAQSGNNRSQSSVQRAISRHTGLLCQTHYEPRDNNIFKGEPSRFAGNELWTDDHTHYFASPFVTVNRKFSLSSGSRFEGFGLGRKIAGLTEGTLSQPGYTADFIPASAITKLALLEHYNADSKTAPRADAVSGVPVISRKAEPSFNNIGRQEQTSSEFTQSSKNRAPSSMQRAISRHTGVLSQQHNESRDNHVFKGGPARFVSNELWTDDHTHYFASPFVTVNRKFSLSSGSRFEGFGLGRKIAGLTEGTLSQPGYAADFIPASTVKKFAPLKYYNADSKTVPRADAVSGVPIISAKAEPSSGIIARQQQILSGAVPAGTNRAQSSVQQAVEKQHSGAVDRSFQPGMLDMRLDLKTALRSIEPGSRHHDSMRGYANIAPISGESTYFYAVDPLLRGSGISSPIKVKPLVQMLLSRQFKDTVSKKDSDDQRDLTVRRAESGDFSRTRANSFSTDAGNLTSGTVRPAAIEHREFFYREQAIDSAMRLPLAPHSSVQRKVSVSGEHPVAGEIPADLQRQDISNSSLLTSPAASTQKAEAAGAEMGKSDSDSVSSDDIADKVWRKLMRKLASEQERMGGSSRWAS